MDPGHDFPVTARRVPGYPLGAQRADKAPKGGNHMVAAQNEMSRSNQLIGLSEVSKMLGVNRATVANWLRQGRIPAFQYGERGIYRLRREDVLSFIERSRLPQSNN
jgi:excisionase family DNA binding protein